LKGISLDSIKGNYIINEKTVQLNFLLGPKGGITKGAIKSFSGKIQIAKDVKKSKFSIVLPVSNLTTFNKYRDESLVEKEYFHVDLYPEMTYVVSKLEVKEDHYVMKGNFKMLGISKPLDVELKYIGKFDSGDDKVPVLLGKSTIDRTLFGMKPDSKEGNVLDFEFKIELVRLK
jgi:polyisoprenoid-binding protein YceI